MTTVRTLLLLLVGASFVSAYLPGILPRDYYCNDTVELKVNKLTSVSTVLPYEYYHLPFCQPEQIHAYAENLGEVLRGDRIENSRYQVKALNNVSCALLCEARYTPDKLKLFAQKVKENYRVHWVLDNLPAATRRDYTDAAGEATFLYEDGFALGVRGSELPPPDDKELKDVMFLNNHVDIRILYHQHDPVDETEEPSVRIIAFEVDPDSVKHSDELVDGVPKTCTDRESTFRQSVSGDKDEQIAFTYSVTWVPTEHRWASRWDLYLKMTDDQIHWFSIVNSLMIVLFLTGMVAMIMMRHLHADIRRYREMETQEEAQEETGWKLVYGDVFRAPPLPMLLSVLVGSGVQVLTCTVITLVFAVIGLLSPANRGALVTVMVVLFVVMGIVAGYVSARLYKMWKGVAWKQNTILTATLVPGIMFVVFLVLDFVILSQKSSGHVPPKTLAALITLWFGVSMPLVFFGAYMGYRKPAIEHPVRVHQIPRQIPEQVWYMQPIFSILMGGILPFGAVFIELFFIMSSIWLHQSYYLFGFLFIVFVILVLTCAEITMVMCYFQLCSEDYHWNWRAFLTSGASALYMFLYSIFYFVTRLDIVKFVSGLIFFGYSFIMALAFFVLTGAIGYFAAFWFVRTIYSSIKLD